MATAAQRLYVSLLCI